MYNNIISYYIHIKRIHRGSRGNHFIVATDAVGHDPVVCFSTTFRLSTPSGLAEIRLFLL